MLCGRPYCPIQSRINAMKPLVQKIMKTSLFGASPPAVFVGQWGYPRVLVGPMVPPARGEEAKNFDDPSGWYGKDIREIIGLRSALVRSNFRENVRAVRRSGKLLDLTQEIAMSARPVDVEVRLGKLPSLRLRYDGTLSPMGPSAPIVDAKLAENPSVSQDVERVVSDCDVFAADALWALRSRGIDVYQAGRLMAAGLLGMRKYRKLVPTRWAITAVDSALGNNILTRVKQYPEISEILLFSAEYLGNHFEILMLPGPYAFELIEVWMPRSAWIGNNPTEVLSDHEGRRPKSYYSILGGGYYATRLPVLEWLERAGRQATVLAVREISSEYWAPLGVWVVRETARHALGKPERFESVEQAVEVMAKGLKVPRQRWLPKSALLRELRQQLKLESFTRTMG